MKQTRKNGTYETNSQGPKLEQTRKKLQRETRKAQTRKTQTRLNQSRRNQTRKTQTRKTQTRKKQILETRKAQIQVILARFIAYSLRFFSKAYSQKSLKNHSRKNF